MPELQFYVPSKLARTIHENARRRNITVSQYLAELIVDELDVNLPEGVYDDLIGQWNPSSEHWLESREPHLLDGIGQVTEERLRDIGITTFGQLARSEHAAVASELRIRAQRVLSTLHSLEPNPDLAHFTVGQILNELTAAGVEVDEEEFARLRAQLRFLLLLKNRFVLELALRDLWPAAPVSNGFTDFEESVDTQKIYVSASEGDDANDGLSAENPVRTLAAGVALLRDGYPDWLLLRRGDVWEESFGRWVLSGRSDAEPMVISSYGSGSTRPILATGTNTGLITVGGGGSPEHMNHLAFIGLHFHAHTRDPSSAAYTEPAGADIVGFRWLRGTSGLLLEDCVFQSYIIGIVLQDFDQLGISNVRIRRCQILDSYSIDSHAQGLYAEGADGLVLEGCLFDHNGWNGQIHGAEGTIYNHNIYIQTNCRNVEAYNNIIMRGASHGMQLRPGGTVEGNLFVRNAIALLVGGDEPVPGGVEATVNNNVFLEGTDITPELPRGWGIELKNISSAVVARNIIAHLTTDSPNAFSVHADAEPGNITYENNLVYDWANGPLDTPGPFVDPNRSVATYNAKLGGPGTFEGFVTKVRGQSRQRWQWEYTAEPVITYIREGFRDA
jgi:hypothetical protein